MPGSSYGGTAPPQVPRHRERRQSHHLAAGARRDRKPSPHSERLLFRPTLGGSISVCLIYPNTYPVAMANLGYQAIYRILAEDQRVTCERAYLPGSPGTTLRTLETGRPVGDFDILALSISFETDYVNVLAVLAGGGLPVRREDRARHSNCLPLVMAGGPATFLNPEPLADFVDLFLIGEGEEMVPEFIDRFETARGAGRGALLEALSAVRGAYVPEHYRPSYDDAGRLTAFHCLDGAIPRVERRVVTDLNAFATSSQVLSTDAVFGDMFMVEASRGCEWGCRFCAAGYMYRPVRYRSQESIRAAVTEGLGCRKTIGLVGAEMASLPGVVSLCEHVVRGGGRPSPSSLKADVITQRLARALAAGGNRSVTVAPEAGSERLRRVINKNLSEDEIVRAARWLVGEGVEGLKLYFMVGLPTERDEDVDAIAALVEGMMGDAEVGGRIRALNLSVNPFVPKPWTPFQWEPMESLDSLRRKLGRLRRRLSGCRNVAIETESPREAYYQAVLSRGDRRVAAILESIHGRGGAWWAVLQDLRRSGGIDGVVPSPDFYVHRPYDTGELLPWAFIDHGMDVRFLMAERRKALAGLQTPPCDVATCHACAAC